MREKEKSGEQRQERKGQPETFVHSIKMRPIRL
jgi:hypothetical protein